MRKCPKRKILSPKGRCIDVVGKTAKKYGLYTRPLHPDKPHSNWKETTLLFDFRWPIKNLTGSVSTFSSKWCLEIENIFLRYLDAVLLSSENKENITRKINKSVGWDEKRAKEWYEILINNPKIKEWAENKVINDNNTSLELDKAPWPEGAYTFFYILNKDKRLKSSLYSTDLRIIYTIDSLNTYFQAYKLTEFYNIIYPRRPKIISSLLLHDRYPDYTIKELNQVVIFLTNVFYNILYKWAIPEPVILIGNVETSPISRDNKSTRDIRLFTKDDSDFKFLLK